jgi:hypothetical protein
MGQGELSLMVVLHNSFWRSAVVAVLSVGILLPPLYLLVMIQYGALTFPYWDHMATSKQIIEYFDGTLTFQSLFDAEGVSRPLFPDLIFVVNAAFTKWDIRSEYIYIYLTVYGALAALLFALWRVSQDWSRLAVLTTALMISILACSPVGAMNHYWSLMLIGTLSYLTATIALLTVSLQPVSWGSNISAAVLAWIAAFSISEGLFVFPAIFLVQQMAAPNILRLNRWSLFWLVNLVVCYAVYFPGINLGAVPRPALLDFLVFVAVYIGNPLGSLLWYPYMDVVWLPETAIINGICGVLLLGLGGFTAWRAWSELPTKRAETRILLSFAAYALACDVVTAWGRAIGQYAIPNANSSRYSIFAAFFLFALIFYYAPKYARREWAFTGWHKAALGVFLAASAVSYVRAIPVYKSAHDDNDWLAEVYGARAETTDLDGRAYPDLAWFNPKRADLHRLGIGPYRSIPVISAPIFAGPFVAPIPLLPGTIVKQRFRSIHPVVRSISFPIVTWAKRPSPYHVEWTAIALDSGATLGQGSFSTSGLSDWQTVTIMLNGSNEAANVEVTFSVEGSDAVRNPIGLALYTPGVDASTPAVIAGKAREDGSKVGLRVRYER